MPRTVAIPFLWVLFSGISAAAPVAGDVVPFKLNKGHLIVVTCSVGGLPELTAIVDTGVTETVLDIGLARRLGLATQDDQATFLTQVSKVWAVSIPGLQLGPLRAERLAGIAVDLSSLTAKLGIRPQVLIGMDLLRRASFTIDYKARQLVFGVAQTLPHGAHLAGSGTDLRFAVIETTVSGRPLRLQVDSGFNGVLVYADRMGDLSSWVGRGSRIARADQSMFAHSFNALQVQIGDWRPQHADVTVADRESRDFDGFDGMIGTQVLSRRRVAFDFEKQMVYWD